VDCSAVGGDLTCDCFYGILDNNEPIVASETGGTWSTVTESPWGTGSSFTGIGCGSDTQCTAIGDGSFYATESAGTWGPATKLGAPASFFGISCADVPDCTAVGVTGSSYPAGTGSRAVHVTETSGAWSTSARVSGSGWFTGISCLTATGCTAVGAFDLCRAQTCRGSSAYPLYVNEVAGVWPTKPSAPRIGRVIAGHGSITASWTPPASSAGAPITGYSASAIWTSRGVSHQYFCASRGLRCTISGLINGKTYAVSIVARSATGPSASSASRRAIPHAAR
jgi:hypothetical protein